MSPRLVFTLGLTAYCLYLVHNAVLGFFRLWRVYRGLQADAYPRKAQGKVFDWRPGAKTAREALRALGLDLFLVVVWVWSMSSSGNWAWASSTTRAVGLVSVFVFAAFAILDFRKWLRLKRASDQPPHPSGGAI